MSRSKEQVIRAASRGVSKKFSQLFVQVDKLLKEKGRKYRTSKVLAITLQILYLQDCKGSDEFMEWHPVVRLIPPPLRTQQHYQLSMEKIDKIKNSTLIGNLKTYLKHKKTK